jgi:hypothetical protein
MMIGEHKVIGLIDTEGIQQFCVRKQAAVWIFSAVESRQSGMIIRKYRHYHLMVLSLRISASTTW